MEGASCTKRNPVLFRNGIESITIGYLMCAIAPVARRGNPNRPSAMRNTTSGTGIGVCPASLMMTLSGSGGGPDTL